MKTSPGTLPKLVLFLPVLALQAGSKVVSATTLLRHKAEPQAEA